MVEGGGDAVGRELADAVGQPRVGVVDRLGAQLAQRVVVAGRCGADDAHAGVAGELDERGADAAVGAVDEDRLTRPHAGLAVQHLPGGHAVDHDGLRLRRVDAVGDRDERAGVEQGVRGPAAGLRDRRDAPADQRRVHAVADRGDDAVRRPRSTT